MDLKRKCSFACKLDGCKKLFRTHICPQCNAAFGRANHLKRHVQTIHEKCKDFVCPECARAFGRADKLALHVRTVHQGWRGHVCPQCAAAFSDPYSLTKHVKAVHEKRKDHVCPQCATAFAQVCHLQRHVQTVHEKHRNHVCPQCKAAFSQAGHLQRHVRTVHEKRRDYVCPECAAAFGEASHLKFHRAYKHDIGPFFCDICKEGRNTQIKHNDLHICRICYRKLTGKSSRIEHIWSDFVDEHFGTDFLVGTDNALRTLGGCSLKRPDKFYASLDRVEIDECDERQHSMSSGSYSCEQKRLSELYDDPSICGKQMVVIRWNPDAYNGPRVSRQERLDLFVRVKRHTRLCTFAPKIVVVYMFYNRDNPQICRDLPHYFIDSEADIDGMQAHFSQ